MAEASTRAMLRSLPPLKGLLPLVVLLVGWQWLGPERSPYFPPPALWWAGMRKLAASGVLWTALWETTITVVYAMAASALLGGVAGLLLGLSRVARQLLGPLLEFCRSLPPPVVAPVAILILGYDQSLKLAVVMWAAVWPVVLNTASQASRIEPLLMDVGRTFRIGPVATITRIVIPATLPAFVLGMRVALPLAIVVALLVEMLTLMPGIGALIVTAQRQFRSADVYGLFVLVGLFGFFLNNLFVVAEQALLSRWPPAARGEAAP